MNDNRELLIARLREAGRRQRDGIRSRLAKFERDLCDEVDARINRIHDLVERERISIHETIKSKVQVEIQGVYEFLDETDLHIEEIIEDLERS